MLAAIVVRTSGPRRGRRAPHCRTEIGDREERSLDRDAGITCALGAEGIVAKRRDRPYRSSRCADWVKVENPGAPAATRIMEW